MSLLRKLAGETAIYGMSYILSRVLHYVVFTWYLTRVFGDDRSQYGIYRDLYFYVAILVIVLTFRMETTYFRYAKDQRPAVTTMSLFFLAALSSVFMLSVWLFRYDLLDWLQYPNLARHILMLALVILFDVMAAVPFAILRQLNRPVRFLLLKLGSIFINIILVLFFLEFLPSLAEQGGMWQQIYSGEDKLFYVILANLLASGITFILLLPLLRQQRYQWDFGFLKKMLAYSWPLVIVGFAGVINQYSATSIQKYILGNSLQENLAEGGSYAAAASLAIILSLFTTAYHYAAEPFFFAHKDKEGSRKVYADAAMAYTLVGSVMMLGILAYLDIIQLLVGKNFRDSLEVVPILLVAFLFLGIYYNIATWYKLADKTLLGMWIALGGTVLTVVLSVVLIKWLGVVGSAWTALACYVFMVFAGYLQGQKYYPIPYRLGRMLMWIGVAIIIYFIMNALRSLLNEKLILILLVNTALIIGYLGMVYLFEKPLLKDLVKRGE